MTKATIMWATLPLLPAYRQQWRKPLSAHSTACATRRPPGRMLKSDDREAWPVDVFHQKKVDRDVRACHSRSHLPAHPPSHTAQPLCLSHTLTPTAVLPHVQVDILGSNTRDAILCLASHFKHYTSVIAPPRVRACSSSVPRVRACSTSTSWPNRRRRAGARGRPST